MYLLSSLSLNLPCYDMLCYDMTWQTSLQLDSANRFKNNMLTAMSVVYKEKGFKGFTIG